MSVARAIVVSTLITSAGVAEAGPAYQALKECLINCINTTPRFSLARALCGADCLADYADTKLGSQLAFNPNFEGTPGLVSTDTGDCLITDGFVSPIDVLFSMPDAPAEIASVSLRLFNDDNVGTVEDFGTLLGTMTPLGGDQFSFSLDPGSLGPDGWLIAEVSYVGISDIDDVGVLAFKVPTPGSVAVMGLGAGVIAVRRRRG